MKRSTFWLLGLCLAVCALMAQVAQAAQTTPTSPVAHHMPMQFVEVDSAIKPVFWQPYAPQKSPQPRTMVRGLIHGIFLCITLTALILGVTLGKSIFLIYGGYFFLLGLNLFIADGWVEVLVFPQQPHLVDALSNSAIVLFVPFFAIIFWRLLFASRQPSLRWALLALMPIVLPGMVSLAPVAGFNFSISWVDASLWGGITLHAVILLFLAARRVGRSYQSNLQARAQAVASAAQLVEQRDFMALLSHEFRNPLAVLDIALCNLNRQPLDDVTTARLGRMTRALARLKYVLGFCLADERLAALGPVQYLRLPVSVADIIEESLQQLDDESQRLQLLAADAASQALLDNTHVLGELPLLGAALKNLLDNALKYAESGPVQLSVKAQGAQVTITVRDHGPGLDEQARSRLFEKFTRGQQHLNSPGAGLGLHLSRKIVQRHGGDIQIHSASGGGVVAELSLALNAN